MKVQYASDLHIEFPENKAFLKANPLKPVGDILVLAGDIVPFSVMHKHADFFNYLSDNFKNTYWIPGNHEYYRSDIIDRSESLHEKIKNNVFLVNNRSVVVENTKFIFSTLWTKIRPAYRWQIEQGMSDFHVIKYDGFRFSAEKYNLLHKKCLDFIQQELAGKKKRRTVVVTHHAPTFLNYPEMYKGNALNDAFAVELFGLIESSQPGFWLYGHTHNNIPDFKIGKTRLLTNQLGYVMHNEQYGFMNDKIIVTD